MTTAEQLKAWEDGLEAYKKDGLTYWIGGYEKIIEKLRAQLISENEAEKGAWAPFNTLKTNNI